MFWVPYSGVIPLSLVWPSGIAATSFSLAAVIAVGRLALLVLRSVRTRAADIPQITVPLDDDREVKQAAA